MSDLFNRYIEKFTNLESHLLCLQDNYGIFKNIRNIKIGPYDYDVISVDNNVVFRILHEDIKKDTKNHYILLFIDKENPNKLRDFISRSEGGTVHQTSIQGLMHSFEENLNWNDKINEYDISDIKLKFGEVIYYGKSLRKNYIEKKDIDKIILSALLDLNATRIKDEADCYLYYKDIRDLYNDIEIFQKKYNTDINNLFISVFKDFSIFMVDIVELDIFDKFDELLWVSNTLNDYEKLTSGNLKIVLGEDFFEIIEKYELYLEEIIELAKLIEKKDKKYYIQKKDWAERTISNMDIDILSDEYGYKEFIKETRGSYISIKNAIQELLKNYNVEGHKKVYSKKTRDLYELQELIDSNKYYKTNNIESVTNIFNEIVKLIKDIEYIEKEEKNIYKINTHNEWEEFYKNHLYDLQYRLSKIRYLDNENLIEANRYRQLDIRLSKTLNRYREKFADLLEENYLTWKKQEYGISRPILNSDISDFIDLENNKNFILIFDGMRYDAWKHIVSPYFKEIFKNKEVNYKSSFALLPSITSISRETIYSDIIKEHRKDTAILTKSESVKNQNEIKEIILEDKKNNIFIFNMFDRDGHRATEDFYIFYDKQRKVFEDTIKELLGLIPENANIIITSDHGLMRIDKYLNLRDKDDIDDIKSRYVKGIGESELETSIKLSNIEDLGEGEKYLLSYSNKGYFVGGGERDFYSHGGASLEEIILPFIMVEPVSSNELLDSNQKQMIKNKEADILEKVIFDDGNTLNLGFKVNDKERLILKTLYNLKNQTITTQDIELKLVRELGSAGMINSMINRLIRKLKKEDLDIIEVSSAGDIILYKFKHNEFKGAN